MFFGLNFIVKNVILRNTIMIETPYNTDYTVDDSIGDDKDGK